jgi:hypothetical protein
VNAWLQAQKDAGLDKVMAELQKQLDAFVAANPDIFNAPAEMPCFANTPMDENLRCCKAKLISPYAIFKAVSSVIQPPLLQSQNPTICQSANPFRLLIPIKTQSIPPAPLASGRVASPLAGMIPPAGFCRHPDGW